MTPSIDANGLQIKTVTEMKKEIIFIAQQLNCGDITEKEAIRELLVLFGVSNMLRRLKNHAEIYSYPSKSFKEKLKKFISNYC